MAKNSFNYFDAFKEMVEGSMAAASLLDEILNNYDPQDLLARMSSMHEIEHSNDELIHITQNNLIKEFIPPIEREDISLLVEILDEPTDSIEEVLFALYMFNICSIRPVALSMSSLIVRAVDTLYEAILEFNQYGKNSSLKEKVIEVNRIEEEGDKMHLNAMRELYVNEDDAVTLIIWTRVLDKLESCLDDIERSANLLESIALKNF